MRRERESREDSPVSFEKLWDIGEKIINLHPESAYSVMSGTYADIHFGSEDKPTTGTFSVYTGNPPEGYPYHCYEADAPDASGKIKHHYIHVYQNGDRREIRSSLVDDEEPEIYKQGSADVIYIKPARDLVTTQSQFQNVLITLDYLENAIREAKDLPLAKVEENVHDQIDPGIVADKITQYATGTKTRIVHWNTFQRYALQLTEDEQTHAKSLQFQKFSVVREEQAQYKKTERWTFPNDGSDPVYEVSRERQPKNTFGRSRSSRGSGEKLFGVEGKTTLSASDYKQKINDGISLLQMSSLR